MVKKSFDVLIFVKNVGRLKFICKFATHNIT